MEYFEDIQDLDDFTLSHLDSFDASDVIGYFRDLATGLSSFNAASIIHCDIEPGNLLIADPNRALVADLGYAKHLPRIEPDQSKLTYVSYTPLYAHPELRQHMIESQDSAANIAEIPRTSLRPSFDLFAFGRSMQEILKKIRDTERSDPAKDHGRRSLFTPYQWRYLTFISKRLLDLWRKLLRISKSYCTYTIWRA